MDLSRKREIETTKAFEIIVSDSDNRKKSALVYRQGTVPSPDKSLAWDVKVTLSPAGFARRMQVAVSAVRPGGSKKLSVLAKGRVSALVETKAVTCGRCDQAGGNRFCSVTWCQEWLPAVTQDVDLPLSESCFFVTKAPLEVQPSGSAINIQIFLAMTHYVDNPCEADLACCEEGKSVIPRLEGLLSSGSLADVTFVVSGEEIKAHRAILGAASDVFLAMFTVDTEDKRTGRVVIKDAGPAAFKEMLRNLYTDSMPRWTMKGEDAEVLLMELLHLSVKYDLHNLLRLCKPRLLSTLSVENVFDRLKVVDVQCPSLVPLITTSFIKGRLQEIITSPDWVAFQGENTALAATVMRKVLAR